MKRFLTIFLITLILPLSLPALDDDPVKEKYTEKLTMAKLKYLEAVDKIRQQLIAEYEKHFSAAMKLNKLEKAQEIKDKIDILKGIKQAADVEKAEEPFIPEPPKKPNKPGKPKKPLVEDDDFGLGGIPQQPE